MAPDHRQSDYSACIGKGMVYAAWILTLGLLTLFFHQREDDVHNPNRAYQTRTGEDGTREITLQRNRFGHYLAIGYINDKPVTFLLDTGATTISIPAGIARSLGLKPQGQYPVSTANGTVTVYGTSLDQIKLGAIVVRHVRANINPHMDGNEVLLGMSVLKDLEIIQRGDKLTLRQVSGE